MKPRQTVRSPRGYMPAPTREAVAEVLEHMGAWLRLSPAAYKPAVMLFAFRLPPEKLLEAFWLAQCRLPEGGQDGFRYFCGICHSMRRELAADHARN